MNTVQGLGDKVRHLPTKNIMIFIIINTLIGNDSIRDVQILEILLIFDVGKNIIVVLSNEDFLSKLILSLSSTRSSQGFNGTLKFILDLKNVLVVNALSVPDFLIISRQRLPVNTKPFSKIMLGLLFLLTFFFIITDILILPGQVLFLLMFIFDLLIFFIFFS
jgi:hypothetical protein